MKILFQRMMGRKMMSEAMFDLLYIIDSVITGTLKILVIIVIIKLMRNRINCLKELKR